MGFEPTPFAWQAKMLTVNTIAAYLVGDKGLEPIVTFRFLLVGQAL